MSQEKSSDYHAKLDNNRKIWDAEAKTFDDEADHSLKLPHVRQAWKQLLANTLADKATAAVLDIGCGTGSLSILLAEMAYTVTGVDFSPEMVALARNKSCKSQSSYPIPYYGCSIPRI